MSARASAEAPELISQRSQCRQLLLDFHRTVGQVAAHRLQANLAGGEFGLEPRIALGRRLRLSAQRTP